MSLITCSNPFHTHDRLWKCFNCMQLFLFKIFFYSLSLKLHFTCISECLLCAILINGNKISNMLFISRLHTEGHCTPSPKFSHAFFLIPHPFLSKCMQQMRKCRKSNLIRIFFYGRKFRRQCANVIDTTWGRIYFLTCKKFIRNFRTQCAETFRLLLSIPWTFIWKDLIRWQKLWIYWDCTCLT